MRQTLCAWQHTFSCIHEKLRTPVRWGLVHRLFQEPRVQPISDVLLTHTYTHFRQIAYTTGGDTICYVLLSHYDKILNLQYLRVGSRCASLRKWKEANKRAVASTAEISPALMKRCLCSYTPWKLRLCLAASIYTRAS